MLKIILFFDPRAWCAPLNIMLYSINIYCIIELHLAKIYATYIYIFIQNRSKMSLIVITGQKVHKKLRSIIVFYALMYVYILYSYI